MSKDWVCNWCGSDQVYEKVFINMNTLKNDYSKETTEPEYAGDCCGEFEYAMHQQEWEEKVILIFIFFHLILQNNN